MTIATKICLLLVSVSCATAKTGVENSTVLNGSWTPVRQEINGKELPAAAFEKQQLTVDDTTYTFSAESVDKGILKYQDGLMDIYGKEGVNAGKHFTAIYKLEHDQLTICYNLAGDGYPAAFETTSKPALFLCVFKKTEPVKEWKKLSMKKEKQTRKNPVLVTYMPRKVRRSLDLSR